MRLTALVDALAVNGGTVEQVRALVRAAELEDEARRAARREGNAERQRRSRLSRSSRVTECDPLKKVPQTP